MRNIYIFYRFLYLSVSLLYGVHDVVLPCFYSSSIALCNQTARCHYILHTGPLKGRRIICSVLYHFVCYVLFSVWVVEMKLVLNVYYFSGSMGAVSTVLFVLTSSCSNFYFKKYKHLYSVT